MQTWEGHPGLEEAGPELCLKCLETEPQAALRCQEAERLGTGSLGVDRHGFESSPHRVPSLAFGEIA